MGNKVCLRDLGPRVVFSRNFRAPGGDSVLLGPEQVALCLGTSRKENTLWGTRSRGLQEFGGVKTEKVGFQVTRSGLPEDLAIPNMRIGFRTRSEIFWGTWAF